MKNFTQLTDCLTMVAAEFGRVCSTGLPQKGGGDYHFAFAADGVVNYTCAVEYMGGEIKVVFFMDVLLLNALEVTAKNAKLYGQVIDKCYKLGGQLAAAGYLVEYN